MIEYINSIINTKMDEDDLIAIIRYKLGKTEFHGRRAINAIPADKVLIRHRKTGAVSYGVVYRPQTILYLFHGFVVSTTLCKLKRFNEVEFWR